MTATNNKPSVIIEETIPPLCMSVRTCALYTHVCGNLRGPIACHYKFCANYLPSQ